MIEREGHLVFNPHYLPLLDTAGRDGWQQPEEVLDALALPADAVIADIGAGSGYFTERFARRLPAGHVYATDVQRAMIERLQQRLRALDNVTVVRAGFDDPGLPEQCCDLVFFSSVYKEIDGRVAYMRKVRRVLRPGGRVAILEFRPGARGAGPPAKMRMVPEQIAAELAEAGFVLVKSHDFLPREWFLVFAAREGAGAGNPATSRL
jgi:ubiquinone/menaquinone biosynthesis C-methylase UbiE